VCTNFNQRKKIKLLNQQIRRQSKQISSLKSVVKVLEEKNLINQDQADLIDQNFVMECQSKNDVELETVSFNFTLVQDTNITMGPSSKSGQKLNKVLLKCIECNYFDQMTLFYQKNLVELLKKKNTTYNPNHTLIK